MVLLFFKNAELNEVHRLRNGAEFIKFHGFSCFFPDACTGSSLFCQRSQHRSTLDVEIITGLSRPQFLVTCAERKIHFQAQVKDIDLSSEAQRSSRFMRGVGGGDVHFVIALGRVSFHRAITVHLASRHQITMGFAFMPIGIRSLVGGWLGSRLMHHNPSLVVQRIGIGTTLLMAVSFYGEDGFAHPSPFSARVLSVFVLKLQFGVSKQPFRKGHRRRLQPVGNE